jgi:hypothetical protein
MPGRPPRSFLGAEADNSLSERCLRGVKEITPALIRGTPYRIVNARY